MKDQSINYRILKAQKRVEEIKGFYSHLVSTFLILPFIVFVNLYTFPDYHWFWFAVGGWAVGLVIHAVNVFFISRISMGEDWKNKKMKSYMKEEEILPEQYLKEIYYMEAKKKVKEIKGFYAHLFVSLVAIPIIIYVNLTYVPEFKFFWLAVGGITISIAMHWLGIYGFEALGLGRSWEREKIKQFIQ